MQAKKEKEGSQPPHTVPASAAAAEAMVVALESLRVPRSWAINATIQAFDSAGTFANGTDWNIAMAWLSRAAQADNERRKAGK